MRRFGFLTTSDSKDWSTRRLGMQTSKHPPLENLGWCAMMCHKHTRLQLLWVFILATLQKGHRLWISLAKIGPPAKQDGRANWVNRVGTDAPRTSGTTNCRVLLVCIPKLIVFILSMFNLSWTSESQAFSDFASWEENQLPKNNGSPVLENSCSEGWKGGMEVQTHHSLPTQVAHELTPAGGPKLRHDWQVLIYAATPFPVVIGQLSSFKKKLFWVDCIVGSLLSERDSCSGL